MIKINYQIKSIINLCQTILYLCRPSYLINKYKIKVCDKNELTDKKYIGQSQSVENAKNASKSRL